MAIHVGSVGDRMFTCENEHGDRFTYRFWSDSAEDMRIETLWSADDATPAEGRERSAEADKFAVEFARGKGWVRP